MKRYLFAVLVMMAIAAAFMPVVVADAFEGNKAEALVYIDKALADPEIAQWVESNYVSKTLFMTALKVAPEKNVLEVAVAFEDFQANGGEMALHWILTWITVGVLVVFFVIF